MDSLRIHYLKQLDSLIQSYLKDIAAKTCNLYISLLSLSSSIRLYMISTLHVFIYIYLFNIYTYIFVIIAFQSPSHVQLFVTSWIAAHQASLSLTFSRSLPKFIYIPQDSYIYILCLVTHATFCDLMDCRPPALLFIEFINTGIGSHSLLLGDLPDQWIKPGSPALQVDSLLSKPPGKP